MKILVTGGAGFMGSWLVDELIKNGHEVVNVDDLSGGFKRNIDPKCKFIKADVRNFKIIDEIVRKDKIEIIYHLAAYAAEGQSIFSPITINDINITPMNNLLVAAVNHDVKKIVFTSSMAVYGSQKPPFSEDISRKPEDPYGCAKAYCERMLEIFAEVYGLRYTILRPHNVYGPRQNVTDPFRNVLGIWINRILRDKPPIIYGDGQQTRAFSYISDVTSPLANAGLFKKADGHIINLGSDKVVSINEACQIVLEVMNSNKKPIHVKERPGEVKHAHCTVEKSERLLNYKTKHTLREGVTKMVDWVKEIGPQKPTYKLPLEITKNAPQMWVEKLM